MTRIGAAATVAAGAALLTAAFVGAPSAAGALRLERVAAGGPGTARASAGTAGAAASEAAAAYRRMSRAQRVGQLFMAGVPSAHFDASAVSLLRRHHVGGVILDGNTNRSRSSLAGMTGHLSRRLRVHGARPFVSTDQEGGEVQRLSGPGFATIPTALQQGRLAPSALRADSRHWGHQLLTAGVDVDLAPDADTVPAAGASSNQPIGQYDREYGHSPGRVATHAVAFLRGMRDAGVTATVKHFPGLGRATGNTDTTPHVTDPTTRHDPYLRPFRKAVAARVPMVMVSSATYPHIDGSRPACFSSAVIGGLLRGSLGFTGVVLSDDLGVTALDDKPVASRAIGFLRAGGTVVLDTTPAQVVTMARAVRHQMHSHPHFAAKVRADALLVLQTKARAGLLAAS